MARGSFCAETQKNRQQVFKTLHSDFRTFRSTLFLCLSLHGLPKLPGKKTSTKGLADTMLPAEGAPLPQQEQLPPPPM